MSAPNSLEKSSRWLVWVSFLILAIALIGILCGPRFILQDFSIYWYSTERWLGGNSPYELPDMPSHVRGEIGRMDAQIAQLKVWAPPYFLFMMSPFAITGLDLGKALYLTVLVGALFGWVWLTSRQLSYGVEDLKWRKKAAYLALAVISIPLCVPKSALTWGGMSILASVAFLLLATSHSFPSFLRWVLFWLLVSIKPHAVFGAVVAFMILLPRRERWRSLSALATVGPLFGFFLIIYSPQVLHQFFALNGSITELYQLITQTLVGRLRTVGVPRGASYFLSGALWSVMLLPVLKMREKPLSFREIVAVAVIFNTVSLFLSPYAWMHDYQSALGLVWATSVLGVRFGRLAALNVSLVIGLNVTESVMYFSSLQSRPDAYALELTFWTVCAALYAACAAVNVVWISKRYQHVPSA